MGEVIQLGEKSEQVKIRTLEERLERLECGVKYKAVGEGNGTEIYIPAEIDEGKSDITDSLNELEVDISVLTRGKFWQGEFKGVRNNGILGKVAVFKGVYKEQSVLFYLPLKDLDLKMDFIPVEE